MSVKLISISKPVIDGIGTAEELIAFTARVSNPSNRMNTETMPNLLRYLLAHKHFSPFEMAHMVVELNTTRDIGRQILRHRSFSFQEFSQRYQTVEDMGFVCREARYQDIKNRQSSLQLDLCQTKDAQTAAFWEEAQQRVIKEAKNAYTWALSAGIAKEQARSVLPEGITMSRLYMAGTIRSFIHYCQIRTGIETQKEHREVALGIQAILKKEFPALAELI